MPLGAEIEKPEFGSDNKKQFILETAGIMWYVPLVKSDTNQTFPQRM